MVVLTIRLPAILVAGRRGDKRVHPLSARYSLAVLPVVGAHTASDSDWPPILIALVLFVVIGGAIVTFNFMRQARAAARRTRRK